MVIAPCIYLHIYSNLFLALVPLYSRFLVRSALRVVCELNSLFHGIKS